MTESDDFNKQVDESFRFLVDNFGFRRISSSSEAPEVWVHLRNATTGVTVHREIGSEPWVEVSRLESVSGTTVERERYALDFLLAARSAQGQLRGREVAPGPHAVRPSSSLAEKAALLHANGEEVLRGDFRIFPQLKELAERRLKERSADLFRPSS
jgi:hypothetical protein